MYKLKFICYTSITQTRKHISLSYQIKIITIYKKYKYSCILMMRLKTNYCPNILMRVHGINKKSNIFCIILFNTINVVIDQFGCAFT